MSTAVMDSKTTTYDERATVRTAPEPIRFGTVMGVELRKMFDTRSGLWLMIGMAVSAVLATGAVIAFSSDSGLTYDNFAAAIGVPMTILLPVLAVLSVTSEWSQRAGLTTFTLVPHRGRVIGAKLAATIAVGFASMAVAMSIGAIGNLLGTALRGVDPAWDLSATNLAFIIGADLVGMLMGFMLGTVMRNSAAAIVSYFSYMFVIPTLSMLLAANQSWFENAQPWIDFSYNHNLMYDGNFTATTWAHFGVTAAVWLVIPLLIGLRRVVRAEVK